MTETTAAGPPAAPGCTVAVIVAGHVYQCYSHDGGDHHFAARWPACPAPFCLAEPGHRTLHDVPSGTPEYVNTAARGCSRCRQVLVDQDDQGWYCQAPVTDAAAPWLTFTDRIHECGGQPHDVISRIELARLPPLAPWRDHLVQQPETREIPVRRRDPAEARARMVAGGIPEDMADEILAGAGPAGEVSAGDVLTPDDAGHLRDFADRCGRAAKTARRIAAANPAAQRLLLDLAAAAETAAASAEAVAGLVEEPSPT